LSFGKIQPPRFRRSAGISREREGTRVRYTLAGDHGLGLWLALREVSAARLAAVERAANDYLGEDVERIGRSELLARLADGDIVVIDVRPSEEYVGGHIDGARSIPLAELERRIAELPRDAELVAYCRGPFCAYAHEAVWRLRSAGLSARRLDEGWPEWRLAARAGRVSAHSRVWSTIAGPARPASEVPGPRLPATAADLARHHAAARRQARDARAVRGCLPVQRRDRRRAVPHRRA
jgi:rhodanese-related sulfurtransferase